jgi:hypothetical protein
LLFGRFSFLKPGETRCYEVHFDTQTRKAFDHIGDVLAPKNFWGDFVFQANKRVGGMRSMVMEQAIPRDGQLHRLDGNKGYIHVRVEPSLVVRPFGVYVQTNDHFDLTDGDRMADGQRAAELVVEHWEGALGKANDVVRKIMELGDAGT